jgi:hypothetical protein
MTQQRSSPPSLHYPAWQREYEASLREHDPKKLFEHVHSAEAAIFNRLQQLAQNSEGADHKAEQQAIADALSALRVLKRDKLNFPDWESKSRGNLVE